MSYKYIVFLLIIAFQSLILSGQVGVVPCSAQKTLTELIQNNPSLAERFQKQEVAINNWIEGYSQNAQSRSLLKIPVVVHVVYRTIEENISNEQILSQLDILNADFRKQNQDLSIVPSAFTDRIADMELEFCLATKDPNGNTTTGITRTVTNQINIGVDNRVYYDNENGKDAWDPSRYLNIWVAQIGGNTLGRASFPNSGLPEEDGIVISPQFFGNFGSAQDSEPHHLGRTCTHEIGHYFNLKHTFGEAFNYDCDDDDGVADTPFQKESYINQCPQSPQFSCGSMDMYMNFMDFTDDACTAMFTEGQKLRVLAAISLFRPGLLNSNACGPTGIQTLNHRSIQISPNPSHSDLSISGLPSNLIGNLEIVDILGITMQQENDILIGIKPISIAHLNRGIYYLIIKMEDEIFVRSFQKI